MITFKNVVGEVLVDDGLSQTMAYTGMGVDPSPRTCVVVTAAGSKASLDVNGTSFELGPGSWLNVTAGTPRSAFRFLLSGKDIRLGVGRLWAVIDRSPHFEEEWGGGGGIRG